MTRIVLLLFFSATSTLLAQQRISDYNSTGWYSAFLNAKLNPKYTIHAEYQWRREDLISNWQQSLLRVATGYQLESTWQLRLGYAWVETFAYGEIPINSYGKTFTEHRFFQALIHTDSIGKTAFTQRIMLEQRWLGTYSAPSVTVEDGSIYLNRARYMVRLQVPVSNKFYMALYNELLIGFGEQIGENIFDQNRAGIIVGIPFTGGHKIEVGYLNQILQLGRTVAGSNVFQRNNGIVVNFIANLDLRKN